MMKANFCCGKEEYAVTLTGGGTGASYECRLLKGEVDTFFRLMLDTKFIRPKHFDLLLQSWRTSTPVEIRGYIYDKEKDFVLSRREDIDRFVIKIILHPTSLNGVELLD